MLKTSVRAAYLLMLVVAVAAWAQSQPADLQTAIRFYEQAEQSIQDCVKVVSVKLKATDELIERRLAGVLETVCTTTDSVESGSRVLQIKESLFDGLKRNLEFLGRERGARFAALYQPVSRLSKTDLADDVHRLDQRIEQRVDQILALVSSLPEEQAIQKDFWRYDGDGSYSVRNPAYSHQQRALGRAGQLRQRAYDGLKASIAKLQRNRVELEQAFKQARTEEGRRFVADLQKQTDELLSRRREQIKTAITKTNSAAKGLGKKSAAALLELVESEKKVVLRDNAEWNRLKSERDVERERLYTCQQRLEVYRQKQRQPSVSPATGPNKG